MKTDISGVFRSVFSMLWMILAISIPFSVNFYFKTLHSAVIYPAEPILWILIVLFIVQLLFNPIRTFMPGKVFLLHPVTICVYIYFFSSAFSTLFSTMFVVSLKALFIKFSYILAFYFIPHILIHQKLIKLMTWAKIYSIPFCIIIVYTLFNHSLFHFGKFGSGYVSEPFYSDHTIYGAALVFLLPAIFSFSFSSQKLNLGNGSKAFYRVVFMLILFGIFFSYCRGAYISIVAALILFFLIKLGIRFKGIIITGLVLVLFLISNGRIIIDSFKKNRIDSNINGAGFYEQIFSLTNITNDLSNSERLNRWNCALRMFGDKPLYGFGPGTFQFQYLPYQNKKEMTYISVTDPNNIMKGNGGSAHSEYLLALSESGFLAFLAFLGMGFVALYTGLKIHQNNSENNFRIYALVLLFSLISYFIHGFFNNFLDNCKLAFLFWTALAVLATMDLNSGKNLKNVVLKSTPEI